MAAFTQHRRFLVSTLIVKKLVFQHATQRQCSTRSKRDIHRFIGNLVKALLGPPYYPCSLPDTIYVNNVIMVVSPLWHGPGSTHGVTTLV